MTGTDRLQGQRPACRKVGLLLLSCMCMAFSGCAKKPSSVTKNPPDDSSTADAKSLKDLYSDINPVNTAQQATLLPGTDKTGATTNGAKSSPMQPGTEKTAAIEPTRIAAKFPGSVVINPAALPGKAPKGFPAAAPFQGAGKTPPAPPRKVEILIKDHVFEQEGTDGVLRVNFDDLDLLRVINMEPVTPDCDKKMPEWLKQLHGKKVRIRGFMAPAMAETDLTAFILARDLQACCFGPNTKIYHLLEVHLKPGLTTDYVFQQPMEVQGTFRIEPGADEGIMFHLYFLENAEIIKKR